MKTSLRRSPGARSTWTRSWFDRVWACSVENPSRPRTFVPTAATQSVSVTGGTRPPRNERGGFFVGNFGMNCDPTGECGRNCPGGSLGGPAVSALGRVQPPPAGLAVLAVELLDEGMAKPPDEQGVSQGRQCPEHQGRPVGPDLDGELPSELSVAAEVHDIILTRQTPPPSQKCRGRESGEGVAGEAGRLETGSGKTPSVHRSARRARVGPVTPLQWRSSVTCALRKRHQSGVAAQDPRTASSFSIGCFTYRVFTLHVFTFHAPLTSTACGSSCRSSSPSTGTSTRRSRCSLPPRSRCRRR